MGGKDHQIWVSEEFEHYLESFVLEYRARKLAFRVDFICSADLCEELDLQGKYFFLNKLRVSWGASSDEERPKQQLIFISRNLNDERTSCFLHINQDKLGLSRLVRVAEDFEDVDVKSNFLSKRLNMIFKAQKLKTFGIIATNPRMAHFAQLFADAKAILEKNGKRHYTFIMNKVNETKLRNFPDIEAFVMISCPFSSFLESAEFKISIFSVIELQLFEDICKIDRVNIVDYLLEQAPEPARPADSPEEAPEETGLEIDVLKMQVPMITEDWVDLGRLTQEQKMQLYRQDSELVLGSFYKHYEYFRDKDWKGLDTQIEVPVQKAKPGESGIPLSYNKIKD